MPQLARQTGSSLADINIVPFVDVMLVLLIIFMITAPILQSGIEVDLPKTQTVKEISEDKLVENIKAFADAVQKAKPPGAKGHYINRVAISSTMGPGVKVEPASLFASSGGH